MGTRIVCGLLMALALSAGAALALQSDLRRARLVVDHLERVVQPRFQDENAGVFGITRIVVLPGHEEVASGRFAATELDHVKAANAANVDYQVSFLRVGHSPGNYRDDNGKVLARRLPETTEGAIHLVNIGRRSAEPAAADRPWDRSSRSVLTLTPALSAVIKKHLPAVQAGKAAEEVMDGTLLALRPVRAEKQVCLGCHAGAKKGDTLGVMVYSVARKTLAGDRASNTPGGRSG